MITVQQKKALKKYLALVTDQESALSYEELIGFLYGIAITPEAIAPDEWLPTIFADGLQASSGRDELAAMIACFTEASNSLIADFQANTLEFPYDLSRLKKKDFDSMYLWTDGFDEALALRPEIWEPEEMLFLSEEKADSVFFSLMIIAGITDPEASQEFFATIPDEIFQEAFPDFDPETEERETQLFAFLLASLPLAFATLQDYARSISKKSPSPKKRAKKPIPIRSAAASPTPSCGGCGSSKEQSSCAGKKEGGCGNLTLVPTTAAKKSTVIQGRFPKKGASAASSPVYQLKITLQGAKPPIWRRIQVPGITTLALLHEVIQICMGWTDYHLHQFIIEKTKYTLPDSDGDLLGSRDERSFTLQALAAKLEPHFQYIYDFGDDWQHRIQVEKILAAGEGHPYPVLLAGKRACPPEDIGGLPGYLELLEISGDPESEEFETTMAWLGEDFSPESFDRAEIAEINMRLKGLS